MKKAQELRDLSEEELLDLYNRVRLHCSRYKWVESRTQGADLDGIIHESFVDVFTGVRNAKPEVSLTVLLCNTVRSKVSHLLQRERKRVTLGDFLDAEGSRHQETLEMVVDQLAQDNPFLTDLVESSESQAVYNELCLALLKAVEGDEILTGIVELWSCYPDLRPNQVARELCLTVSQVQQAQKRLRRKVKHVKEVWANG